MSADSEIRNYFDKGQIPLLAILNVVLWAFIVVRLRGLRESNRDYPSHWRTVSAGCIVFAGVLCTAYFVCWIVNIVLNERLYKIGQAHHIPDDYRGGPPLNITVDSFSHAEMSTMIEYVDILDPLMKAARTILVISLWFTKLAFVTSFLATGYCLRKWLRWALYVTTVIIVLSLGVATWATSWVMSNGFEPYTPEAIVDTQMWLGLSYTWTTVTLECLPTGLNIATDVLRKFPPAMKVSSGQITLLVTMLCITIATALTRLVIIVEYLHLSIVNTSLGNDYNMVESNKLSVVSIVLSEVEVILSAIVSCLPGMRAWVRSWPWKRRVAAATSPASDGSKTLFDASNTSSKANGTHDLENANLEYWHSPAVSTA